jgi:hypothetical protein
LESSISKTGQWIIESSNEVMRFAPDLGLSRFRKSGLRLVVPPNLNAREILLISCHNGNNVGRSGIFRCGQRVRFQP